MIPPQFPAAIRAQGYDVTEVRALPKEIQRDDRAILGIILIPQAQISSRLGRWRVRDRLLRFLNQRTADELNNELWWLPKE